MISADQLDDIPTGHDRSRQAAAVLIIDFFIDIGIAQYLKNGGITICFIVEHCHGHQNPKHGDIRIFTGKLFDDLGILRREFE